MENQDQNIKTENEQIIPKTKPKKRKKKTVSAEQTINFALWHMKIYLIDNGGCSVSLRKIFCFNDIIHI